MVPAPGALHSLRSKQKLAAGKRRKTDFLTKEEKEKYIEEHVESKTAIRNMYFSHWKTPGVSERMWSVNLDASISAQYQTLGGHSGWASESLGSLMTATGVPWE